MRYVVKFINQYWTLFDTFNYRPIELFGLKVDADAAAAEANAALSQRR